MTPDDETPWYRSLLVSVGALLAVALVIGAVVGTATVGAVRVIGLGGSDGGPTGEPTLFIPDRTPGGSDDDDDDPGLTLSDLTGENPDDEETGDPTTGPDASEAPSPRKNQGKNRQRSVISLSVSPTEVASMERIYLTGTYPGGEGAALQVERLEGAWTPFPVTASVSGGTFSTYIVTGRSGPNTFRVVDTARGKKSNPVKVQVR